MYIAYAVEEVSATAIVTTACSFLVNGPGFKSKNGTLEHFQSGNDSKGDSSSQENSKSATGNQLDTPSTLFQMRRTSSGPSASHRGPRRPQKNRYNTDRSKSSGGGSSNTDNVSDLFQWQNAK